MPVCRDAAAKSWLHECKTGRGYVIAGGVLDPRVGDEIRAPEDFCSTRTPMLRQARCAPSEAMTRS
jgi:hypothetical protein